MGRRLTAGVARAVRAVRGLWPDHNPLRRTLDRVEAAIVGGLAVAFLAGAPWAAQAAARWADAVSSAAARAQQAWQQVPATLLADAPDLGYARYDAAVPARWTTPDGTRRSGTVSVRPGAKAGSTVMVWEDASGWLTGVPPLRLARARDQAGLAAVLGPVGYGFLLVCAGLLTHGVLGRRRLAAWDADWRATEPRWTRRH